MKLSELNETIKFDADEKGIVVYLDKENNTFRIVQDKETEALSKRGLTHTIKSRADYKKVASKYDVDVSLQDWFKISNAAKKKNKDTDFRRALAAMQKDIVNLHREKK